MDNKRERLGIEGDFSFLNVPVVSSLNQIIEWRGKPLIIWVDIAPELLHGFSSSAAHAATLNEENINVKINKYFFKKHINNLLALSGQRSAVR